MRYLLIILFTLSIQSAMAHGSEIRHAIGDRAQALKSEKKVIHEDLSVIRKMHPQILYHKRDKTLRQGVRTRQDSLKACVNCHVNTDQHGEYLPINQKDQFCSTCHQKVGVSLDCFSCHRNIPKGDL
jgi:hypothetical protein